MKCYVCRELFPDEELIEHHTDYDTKDSIMVCPPCHSEIHKGDNYPKFKPKQKRPAGYNGARYITLYFPKNYYSFIKSNIRDFNKWIRQKIDEEKEKQPAYCKEKIAYWKQKLEKLRKDV